MEFSWREAEEISRQLTHARQGSSVGRSGEPTGVLQLRAAGIDPVAQAFFRDHHAYTENDVRDLLQLGQRSEAGGFVTTEKDAVNLGGYLAALARLAVVPVKMELADAGNAVDTMLHVIEERRRRS